MQSPRCEDMTNPSDWLYQWNKTYNLLAAGGNLISTVNSGYDTYGVKRSNLDAAVGFIGASPQYGIQ